MTEHCNRNALMHKIQTESFVALELQLFLNTHPNCSQALCLLNEHLAARRAAVELYERDYAPLTAYGLENACRYDWIDNAWPWEKEA